MASLVDAANPVVFLDAASAGLASDEPPDQIELGQAVLAWLESARRGAAVAMGLAASHERQPQPVTPFVAVVAPPHTVPDAVGRAGQRAGHRPRRAVPV